MNNEDINPSYKGRFLKDIVADYELEHLKFDEGTILIQEAAGIKVFFQLKSDYIYYNEWSDEIRIFSRRYYRKNPPMEILPGSIIDSTRRLMPDSLKFCLAQHVRVPADDELKWYESLDVV